MSTRTLTYTLPGVYILSFFCLEIGTTPVSKLVGVMGSIPIFDSECPLPWADKTAHETHVFLCFILIYNQNCMLHVVGDKKIKKIIGETALFSYA